MKVSGEMIEIHGTRDHASSPTKTFGGKWLAYTIFDPDSMFRDHREQFYNDIWPVFDDPNHPFRTKENSPHLTPKQIRAINYPHTAEYRHIYAVTKSYSGLEPHIINKRKALEQERNALKV